MTSLFTSWRFWACAGLAMSICSYFGWKMYSEQNKSRSSSAQSTSSDRSSSVTDSQKGVIQPARELQTGSGITYHSQPDAPEPTPTPEKILDPPLVLCDFPMAASTPTPASNREETQQDDRFLSRFTFIPVRLMVELDSSHMTTPVLAIVTENIWQQTAEGKKLIIEKGSQIGAFLTPGYTRSNVEIKGEMTLIFLDGLELTFDGIFCNQEYDVLTNHYGLYDKSGGIKGQLIQSDHFAFVRNMMGYLAETASKAVDTGAATLLQEGGRGGNVASFQVSPGQAVISPYIERMINPLQLADTVFVQVPNGKKAYVVNTSLIEPGFRSKGARLQIRMKKKEEEEPRQESSASFDLKHAQQLLKVAEKQVTKEEEPQNETKSDPNAVLK